MKLHKDLIPPRHLQLVSLPYNPIQSKIRTTFHLRFQLATLRDSNSSKQQLTVSSSIVCVCVCVHANVYSMDAFMRVCVCMCTECNHSINIFSQLIGLSIEGHSICLHMNGARLTAAHPANRCTVEGRPATDVLLVHHCGFRLLFGLSFWQLEFHELVGLLEAAVGHGRPSKAR